MSKWISVKDKLPKIGQEVLVYYEIRDRSCFAIDYIRGINTYEYEEGKANRSIDWAENSNPSHWMPMPEPPSGE